MKAGFSEVSAQRVDYGGGVCGRSPGSGEAPVSPATCARSTLG